MSEMPDLKPFMLRCLTYAEVLRQMRVTGCAGRRNHWCAPVLVYQGTRLLLDDEGEFRPWKANGGDRRASDWEMVQNPAAAPDEPDLELIAELGARAGWF